ncbi:hypothetical protein FMUBM48_01870 [Nocardia cyriacigeorgica]|nr:hypothetical protein FMUBM48_01870 [Nocardia cyriacigeorgica]
MHRECFNAAMTWTTIARSLSLLAVGTAAGLTLAAPAQASDANPLDCSGVPHAQGIADRHSGLRGVPVVPVCMNNKVYIGIPLAVSPLANITLPGTTTVCLVERETVEAAARFEWRRDQHVVPMCIANRAYGVYEP